MEKFSTFDHYLQEALRELDKPCEEFDEQKCQRLLERYCSALVSSQKPRENSRKETETRSHFKALSTSRE
jgi:uncharacterized protein YfbU (UPF0304 family)